MHGCQLLQSVPNLDRDLLEQLHVEDSDLLIFETAAAMASGDLGQQESLSFPHIVCAKHPRLCSLRVKEFTASYFKAVPLLNM